VQGVRDGLRFARVGFAANGQIVEAATCDDVVKKLDAALTTAALPPVQHNHELCIQRGEPFCGQVEKPVASPVLTPKFSELSILVQNVVTTARESGYLRGRGKDTEESDRKEDDARFALRDALRELETRLAELEREHAALRQPSK
jgi:hypothetical protein